MALEIPEVVHRGGGNLSPVKESDVLGHYQLGRIREKSEYETEYQANLSVPNRTYSNPTIAKQISKIVDDSKVGSEVRTGFGEGNSNLSFEIVKMRNSPGYAVLDMFVNGQGVSGRRMVFKTQAAAKSYTKNALLRDYFRQDEHLRRMKQ